MASDLSIIAWTSAKLPEHSTAATTLSGLPADLVLLAPESAGLQDILTGRRTSYVPVPAGQHVWRGLERAVAMTKGGCVAFLNLRATPSLGWPQSLLAAFDDASVGCAAGDIVIGHGEVQDRSQQRVAVSGWRGAPYANLSNAAYRRDALDQIGALDPDLGAAAEAELTRRMFERTPYRLVHLAHAEVTFPAPQDLGEIWDEALEGARTFAAWNSARDKNATPAATALLAGARASFQALVGSQAGPDRAKLLIAGSRLARGVAGLVGALDGAGASTGKQAACLICGNHKFAPGPNGRLVGTLAPHCTSCGSLERHRVLRAVLDGIDDKTRRSLSALVVGEPPHKDNRIFARTQHVAASGLHSGDAPADAGIVIAVGEFSLPHTSDFASSVEALVSPLGADGALILLERLANPNGPTAPRQGGGFTIGIDFGASIRALLPDVTLASAVIQDPSTWEAFIAIVASVGAVNPDIVLARAQARLNRAE